MTLPLHHVSFRGRGSMVGPPPVRYFTVAAATRAEALRVVEEHLGGADGDYAVARTERVADGPGITSESYLAA